LRFFVLMPKRRSRSKYFVSTDWAITYFVRAGPPPLSDYPFEVIEVDTDQHGQITEGASRVHAFIEGIGDLFASRRPDVLWTQSHWSLSLATWKIPQVQ
jgi:hypothetical protein